MNSVKTRLLNLLQSGGDVTSRTAASLLNTPEESIAKRVYDLRREGYAIYANRVVNNYGNSIVRYRLGAPNKAIVSAAFKAFGRKATDGSAIAKAIVIPDNVFGDRTVIV